MISRLAFSLHRDDSEYILRMFSIWIRVIEYIIEEFAIEKWALGFKNYRLRAYRQESQRLAPISIDNTPNQAKTASPRAPTHENSCKTYGALPPPRLHPTRTIAVAVLRDCAGTSSDNRWNIVERMML